MFGSRVERAGDEETRGLQCDSFGLRQWQLDGQPWIIDIPRARTTEINLEPTTLFSLQTSIGIEVFQVERRFRDFRTMNLSLRSALSSEAPELVERMPEFPRAFLKWMTNHLDPGFVENRRQELLKFMQALLRHLPQVKRHPIFLRFVGLNVRTDDSSRRGALIKQQFPLLMGTWSLVDWAAGPAVRAHQSLVVARQPSHALDADDDERQATSQLFLYGGSDPRDDLRIQRDCWRLAVPESDLQPPSSHSRWKPVLSYGATPGPLAQHQCVALPGSSDLVVVGGRNLTGDNLAAYLFSNNHWYRVADYPLPSSSQSSAATASCSTTSDCDQSGVLVGHSLVFYSGSLWVFERGRLSQLSPSDASPAGEPSKYASSQWTWQLVDASGPQLTHHCAVIYQDSMYIFGGYPSATDSDAGRAPPTPQRDVWKYDFLNGSWTLLAPGPRGLVGHRAVIIGHRMMVFGGRDLRHRLYNDLLCYNIHTDAWRTIVPLQGEPPSPRSDHSCAASLAQDAMYVFGGDPVDNRLHRFSFFSDPTPTGHRRRRSFSEYDPTTRSSSSSSSSSSPPLPPSPSQSPSPPLPSSSQSAAESPTTTKHSPAALLASPVASSKTRKGASSPDCLTAFDELIGTGGFRISIPACVQQTVAGDSATTYFVIETRPIYDADAAAAASTGDQTKSVQRRFSEFQALDAELRAVCPSDVLAVLPELPKGYWKILKDHQDKEFIERRRLELTDYLSDLKSIPFVVMHPAFEKFIGRVLDSDSMPKMK